MPMSFIYIEMVSITYSKNNNWGYYIVWCAFLALCAMWAVSSHCQLQLTPWKSCWPFYSCQSLLSYSWWASSAHPALASLLSPNSLTDRGQPFTSLLCLGSALYFSAMPPPLHLYFSAMPLHCYASAASPWFLCYASAALVIVVGPLQTPLYLLLLPDPISSNLWLYQVGWLSVQQLLSSLFSRSHTVIFWSRLLMLSSTVLALPNVHSMVTKHVLQFLPYSSVYLAKSVFILICCQFDSSCCFLVFLALALICWPEGHSSESSHFLIHPALGVLSFAAFPICTLLLP